MKMVFIILVFWALLGITRLEAAYCPQGGYCYNLSGPQVQTNKAQGLAALTDIELVDLNAPIEKTIGTLFSFLLAFAAVAALVMIVIGAIQYMYSAGNQSLITAARGRIMNSILGLVLALLSYLFLYTINRDLVSFRAPALPPPQIAPTPIPGGVGTPGSSVEIGRLDKSLNQKKVEECPTSCALVDTAAGTVDCNCEQDASSFVYTRLREQEARQTLAQNRIQVNNARACPPNTNYQDAGYPCTSFTGIRSDLVDRVVKLKKDCNCDITVTGGTEFGHAGGTRAGTHASGFKIDLRATQALDDYVTKNFKRADGAACQDVCNSGDGFIWRREADHWDIVVTKIQ